MPQPDYHIAVAHYLRMHTIRNTYEVRHHTAQASGYGRSRLEARVRAAYEAVERYSFTWQGSEYVERGTLDSMGADAVPPNDVMLFSERQFSERDATNASMRSVTEFVPEALDPSVEIEWAPGWAPLDKRWMWIPATLCYDGYPRGSSIYGLADSNGVAAGPTRHFCVVRGIYELIERDLFSLFYYNKLKKRAVDLASWQDPYFDATVTYYERTLGRTLAVLDLRPNLPGTDLPFYLPLYGFAAVSWDQQADDVVLGFGVHPRPREGIRRALEECQQMLPNVLPTDKPGAEAGFSSEAAAATPSGDAPACTWDVQMHDHFRPDETRRALQRDDYSGEPSITSLQQLFENLADHGIRVVIQDLTRPETGIPVMRVLAPGLRPWWKRFAPGRLYDAPVAAGELDRALAETELNQIPVTF